MLSVCCLTCCTTAHAYRRCYSQQYRINKLVSRRLDSGKPISGSAKKKSGKKSGGGIQAGLSSFFGPTKKKSPSDSPSAKRQKTPPTSPDQSDVEVIELDGPNPNGNGVNKRKVVESVEMAESNKKRK